MPIDRCRVCGNGFFETPLLRYENMPKAAQCMPDAESLADDVGVELEVRQCSGCGLVQLSNDPVPYYRDVIRAAAFSEEMRGFRNGQFADFIRAFALEAKKVIEIGCGRGEYLSIMAGLGVDGFGLEHSEESVAACLESGLKVSKGFIRSGGRIPGAPFDGFFILNFLEHLPDPSSCLRGIHENLAPEGVGLVEVPNFDMILRKNIFSEFIGDHLFYFTRESLSATLERNGFEVVDCRETWYDYLISARVRKRKPLDITLFHDFQIRLKADLHAYVDRFGAKRVAIWGAGHQALAVIAMVDLAAKIRYIVDSAPFKQGRYTPATHIPILPPDTLRSDPVDAVIVMAASYSDEVARILREKYDRRMSVAILRDLSLEIIQGEPG